jgi:hypothetical protein
VTPYAPSSLVARSFLARLLSPDDFGRPFLVVTPLSAS